MNVGAATAVDTLPKAKPAARRSGTIAIKARLRDDFAWKPLRAALAGGVSGLIIVFFSSVAAYAGTSSQFVLIVPPTPAEGNLSWMVATRFPSRPAAVIPQL